MINCKSVKTNGKPDQLKNIVSSLHADVINGNDPWLNSSIKSAAVFTDVFNSYRRDRRDGNGEGVFILQSQKHKSHQPEELVVDSSSDCEMVWSRSKELAVSVSAYSTDLLIRTKLERRHR